MSEKNIKTPVVEATGVIPERGTVEGEKLFAEQQAAAEKAAAEKAAAEKAAAEKAAAEKAAAEKAAAEKAAAEKAEAEKVEAEKADITIDATIIPSGIFVAENGDEFEFLVSSFTFQGTVYNAEEALRDYTDVLEHLASIKSFILKKI